MVATPRATVCMVLLTTVSSTAAKTILFHKPVGIVCTHHDELGRRTVYDAIRELLPPQDAAESWHACGRLDAQTSGLLIVTTDGPLVRHVTDPTAGANLEKIYIARCHLIDAAAIAQLRRGVDLGAGLGMSRPASVTLDDPPGAGGAKQSWLTIGIREGKNRQIRRMLHAVGSGVMSLERRAIGGLELGDLGEGEIRWLSDDALRDALGYNAAHEAATTNDGSSSSGAVVVEAFSSSVPRPKGEAKASPSAGAYRLLDSGECQRLESWGERLVVRPCPAATWRRGLSGDRWAEATLRYVEASQAGGDAGGEWRNEMAPLLPTADAPSRSGTRDEALSGASGDAAAADPPWLLDQGVGFSLGLQPGPSGQLGAFPEQTDNWRWLRETCAAALVVDDATAGEPRPLRVLNLFGHTGGSSLACAAGLTTSAVLEQGGLTRGADAPPTTTVMGRARGVEVVHLDGARAAVSRARTNAAISGLADADDVALRWICEDALTFVQRCAKRGERFDGIIVDPPAFGRGGKSKGKNTKGEWRIQRDMPSLLAILGELLSDDPAFCLLTCHDARWPSDRLADAVAELVQEDGGAGAVEQGQMMLKASEARGKDLPMGAFARWRRADLSGSSLATQPAQAVRRTQKGRTKSRQRLS